MKNIKEIIQDAYSNYGGKDFVHEKAGGKYGSISYAEFIEEAACFAHFLLNRGLREEHIALYSENTVNLMIADLAILGFVGVVDNVPAFYKAEQICEIIESLDVKCVIYNNTKQDEINKVKAKKPELMYISLQDDFGRCVSEGRAMTDGGLPGLDLSDFPVRNMNVCSKIVFSSGTTSRPKAIMLSLKNIFSGWNSLCRRAPLCNEDVIYLYLPLCHTYANIYNFLYALLSGLSIFLCSDIKNIAAELREVNPTVFCSTPYMYIKLLEEKGDNIRYAFGERIKYMFAGGSMLPMDIKRSYMDNGLFILDAYALSETASSLCISYMDYELDGSVGTIFEDIHVIICNPDEDGVGEIAVKGDNVFIGYANEPGATAKVMDGNGYFHTGDRGYISGKKLFFKDRIKPVLVTSKGENVNAERIRNIIMEACNKFTTVNIYVKNDRICVDAYMESTDMDGDEMKELINEKLLKSEKIDVLNIIGDDRLKK